MLTKKELEEIRTRHETYRPSARDVPDLLAHIAEQEARIEQLQRALERAQRRIDGLKGVDSTASVFEGR